MTTGDWQQVLFTNVRVWDGNAEDVTSPTSVLVEGNRIKSVGRDVQTDAGANVIDGDGRVLMPGLIDAHWHATYVGMQQAEMIQSDVSMISIVGAQSTEPTLMRGFTTVRDMGGNVFSIKKLIDRGELVGPRFYPSGPPIAQTSGHFDFRGPNDVPANPTDPLSYFEHNAVIMVADGVGEVTKRVREVLRMGATQVKLAAGGGVSSLYDQLDVAEYTVDEIKAAVEVAESWNTYVAVHVFTDAAVRKCVNAGVKSIEHGFLLHEETHELLAKKGVWLCPQPMLDDEDAPHFADPFSNAKYAEVVKGTDETYVNAKKHGVNLAWGTDLLFDPSAAGRQGKLLAKMKRWFTPQEILKLATSANGRLVKMCGPRDPYPGKLGVVEEGALADLLLVNGNPLKDIDIVVDADANFALIMKDGRIYKNTIE